MVFLNELIERKIRMIHVKDKYYIDVKNGAYKVKRLVGENKSNGKPLYKSLGDYGTLRGAISKLVIIMVEEKISESGVIELNDAVRIIQRENREMREILKKIIVEEDSDGEE